MQEIRLDLSEDDVEIDWMNFKNLIESFYLNGYSSTSHIVCDGDLHIMDGAHRLAACLYFNIPTISVKVVPKVFECEWI